MVQMIDDFLAGVSPEQKERPSKRGKTFAPPVRCANSDGRGGMGQRVDADMIDAGRKLLREALGSGE